MNSSRNAAMLHRSTTEIALGAVILVILMIGAFVGNLLTSLIFWRRPRLLTSTNISILFLAISDVLMASLVMPFSLASLIKETWIFSSEACTVNAFLVNFLLGVSLITMTCTAVIRYLCVVKRTLHRNYAKPKVVAVGISILWLLHFVLQIFLLFVSSGRGTYRQKQLYCIYYFRKKDVGVLMNYSGFAGAFILGLIIFLAYFKVFRFVSCHNHTVQSNLQQANHSHVEEVKITKTLVTVVLGFASCWAPVIIIFYIDLLGRYKYPHLRMPMFVFLFQTICIFVSSFINPLIYALTNRSLRKEYFELLRSILPSGAQIAPNVEP